MVGQRFVVMASAVQDVEMMPKEEKVVLQKFGFPNPVQSIAGF